MQSSSANRGKKQNEILAAEALSNEVQNEENPATSTRLAQNSQQATNDLCTAQILERYFEEQATANQRSTSIPSSNQVTELQNYGSATGGDSPFDCYQH